MSAVVEATNHGNVMVERSSYQEATSSRSYVSTVDASTVWLSIPRRPALPTNRRDLVKGHAEQAKERETGS